MSSKKRDIIDKKVKEMANRAPPKTKVNLKDLRLKAYMQENPELKKVYKEEYEKAKAGIKKYFSHNLILKYRTRER